MSALPNHQKVNENGDPFLNMQLLAAGDSYATIGTLEAVEDIDRPQI